MAKHLYMVALVPPKKVIDRVEEVRQEFAQNYKCKAALKNPVHITLLPPFQLEEEFEEELLAKLKEGENRNRFLLEASNYGSFTENEILFISVNKPKPLAELQAFVAKTVRGNFETSEKHSNKEEFHPHITIGRKDIPKGRFADAVKEYSELKFSAKFEIKSFYLWKHNSKEWEVYNRFPLIPVEEVKPEEYIDFLESPVGWLKIVADDKSLLALDFMTEKPTAANGNKVSKLVKKQLEEYFSGSRQQFDLPLNPQGTAFQQKVWKLLVGVDFGQTQSYMAISKKYGDVKAIRAVGTANGKNPIPIIIPCHRIVGSNGNLVGYSGGLWRKEWLLAHEARFGGQQSLF